MHNFKWRCVDDNRKVAIIHKVPKVSADGLYDFLPVIASEHGNLHTAAEAG